MTQELSFESITGYSEHFYRIDWIGYLKRETGAFVPNVEVFFSKLNIDPNSKLPLDINHTSYSAPLKRVLPVSILRTLRVGDILHKGKRIKNTLESQVVEAFHIDVNRNTTQTLHSGGKINNKYILPFQQHPYHRSATKTYCEVITIRPNMLLVIPHYTIIQSYFASCQNVFEGLFKFGLNFDSFYNPDETHIDSDGKAFVMLKKSVHDEGVAEVARIAFDRQAKNAVKMISENQTLQFQTKEFIRPKTQFPFIGKSKLHVSGKWLQIADNMKSFIVFNISACSSKFPFTQLEFFRESPGDKNPDDPPNKTDTNLEQTYRKPVPKHRNSEYIELDLDTSPSSQIEQLRVSGAIRTSFYDLKHKKISKVRKAPHKTEPKHSKRPDTIDVAKEGLGDQTAYSETAPIEITVNEPEGDTKDGNNVLNNLFKNKICRLRIFLNLLIKLNSSAFIKDISYECINSDLGKTQNMFSFFQNERTASSRKTTWQFINYLKGYKSSDLKNNEQIRRKAIIAKLKLANNQLIYIIEIERRCFKTNKGNWLEMDDIPFYIAIVDPPNQSITPHDFKHLFEYAVLNRGKWDHEHLNKRPGVKSMYVRHAAHKTIENNTFVDSQIKIIENQLGFELIDHTKSK